MEAINLFTNEDTLLYMLQFRETFNKEMSEERGETVKMSLQEIIDYCDISKTIYCEGSKIFPFNILTINKKEYLIYMYEGDDNDEFIIRAKKIIESIEDYDELKPIEDILAFDYSSPYFMINNQIRLMN